MNLSLPVPITVSENATWVREAYKRNSQWKVFILYFFMLPNLSSTLFLPPMQYIKALRKTPVTVQPFTFSFSSGGYRTPGVLGESSRSLTAAFYDHTIQRTEVSASYLLSTETRGGFQRKMSLYQMKIVCQKEIKANNPNQLTLVQYNQLTSVGLTDILKCLLPQFPNNHSPV